MPSHSDRIGRRRFFTGAGVVMSLAVAGCASFSGPQTATGQSARIVIVLDNPDDTPQDYEVEVFWGENNSSRFSGTLQPTESGTAMTATTGTAPESATFLIGAAEDEQTGTWSPIDCPDYRVEAVLANGTPAVETTCQA